MYVIPKPVTDYIYIDDIPLNDDIYKTMVIWWAMIIVKIILKGKNLWYTDDTEVYVQC